jgi:hypothetical protein
MTQWRLSEQDDQVHFAKRTIENSGRWLMSKIVTFSVVVAALLLAGCASQEQFLNNKQGMAIQTAMSRGQFETNCQNLTPTVISREVVQPALQGPFVNGIERAEFTIGVAGCDQKKIFVVVCPEGGEGCFAAGPGRFHAGY